MMISNYSIFYNSELYYFLRKRKMKIKVEIILESQKQHNLVTCQRKIHSCLDTFYASLFYYRIKSFNDVQIITSAT